MVKYSFNFELKIKINFKNKFNVIFEEYKNYTFNFLGVAKKRHSIPKKFDVYNELCVGCLVTYECFYNFYIFFDDFKKIDTHSPENILF